MPDIPGAIFKESELQTILREIQQQFVTGTAPQANERHGGSGVEGKFIDKVRMRDYHYHNSPAVDAVLDAPYDQGVRYQSDAIRRTHEDMKARLTENHFVIKSDVPRETATLRDRASRFDAVMNSGLMLVESRQQIDIQGGLADAACIFGLGWLHWSKADDIFPHVPEYEWMDELPPDPGEAKRFEAKKRKGPGGKRQYRETDESVQQRYSQAKARAGFPWFVETPHPSTVMFIEDRSTANGLGMVLHLREVNVAEYVMEMQKKGVGLSFSQRDGKFSLSFNEVNEDIHVYGPVDAPSTTMPSGNQVSHRCAIATLWTRDECYELVSDTARGADGGQAISDSFLLVDHFTHPYGMPPFARVPATDTLSPDPAWRYESAYEGMFRVKPALDRQVSLQLALSEQVALPWWFLKATSPDPAPLLSENGDEVELTRDSMLSDRLPPGWDFGKLEQTINEAFIGSTQFLKQEMDAARPATGNAEVDANTQPWSVRLQQDQASVYPKKLLGRIANAIQIMARNMAYVMSLSTEDGGFGEEVTVYARDTEKGEIDYTTTVSVAPEEIPSLNVNVAISAVSSAEQLTLQEHGRQLLADPHVPITPIDYLRDYMNVPDPDAQFADYMSWQVFQQFMLPNLIAQEVARWQGTQIVLGVNGEAIGPGGQPVDPTAVLAQNGIRPTQQPASPAPQAPNTLPPGAGGPVAPMPQQQMPGLPPLTTPETIPLPGRPAA